MSFSRQPLSKQSQDGVALIAVLWVVAMLSIVLSTVLVITRTELQLARFELASTHARNLSEAGVYLAIARLHTPRDSFTPGLPTGADVATVGGRDVRIEISNEAGKIDLNTADLALISSLLDSRSIPRSTAQRLRQGLTARRRAVTASGAPFRSFSEATDFLAQYPPVLKRVHNSVTVHNGQAGINPTVASPETLRAVPGWGAAQVEAYLSRREKHRLESPPVRRTRKYFTDRLSAVYTISARTEVDGVHAQVQALVRMSSDPTRPYDILTWRQTDLDI